MSKLADYIASFEKKDNEPQTHMWMSYKTYSKYQEKPSRNLLLHVPQDKRNEFYRRIYDYVNNTDQRILQNRYLGENCITEKIYTGQFKFYIDLDFKLDAFECGLLSTSRNKLIKQMNHCLDVIHDVVCEAWGEDIANDSYLAMRLPYKLHMHYPNIITDSTVACFIIDAIRDVFKKDQFCAALLNHDPNLLDSSVYRNGLRMIGMHKGRMIKDNNKDEAMQKLYKKLLPSFPYSETYWIVDDDTYEKSSIDFDDFMNLSIHVPTNAVKTPCAFDAQIMAKSKGKAKMGTMSSASQVASSSGTKQEEPDNELNCEEFVQGLDGLCGTAVSDQIPNTIEYLYRHYNHLIPRDKIKMKNNVIVVPLNTKECPFLRREHSSNHQYIIVDINGSRQRCHDCKKSHKAINASKFSGKVMKELKAIGLLRDLDITKPTRKAKSAEEKATVFQGALVQHQDHFPQYNLKDIDSKRVVFRDTGVYYRLPDSWCEICKTEHKEPCTYLHLMETGHLVLKCVQSDQLFKFGSYPTPPIKIDPMLRSALFVNVNFNITQNTYIQYNDTSGDVSVVFEKFDIFEDDTLLNHLVHEALAGTTFKIVELFHYVAKTRFNCTSEGKWYEYINHRWNKDKTCAISMYLSKEFCQYFRIARDYYRENTSDPNLVKHCEKHINEIITNLNNITSKEKILKEAQWFFFQEDHYLSKEKINFEDRLDGALNLIGFSNGVFDLDTMTFRDGEPDDCISMSCRYNYRVKSNPEIRRQVMQFLTDIQPKQKMRDYMLMHLASCLHGENNQEHYHIYTGKGRNGKSKLQDLIKDSFGDYYFPIASEMLTRERPNSESPTAGLVNLRGRRLIIASEPKASEKLNGSYIKLLTGNDNLTGRKLNSNKMEEFKPQFQLIALTNDIPVMDGTDEAIFMRSRIINFPTRFTHNPVLPNEKLINESLLQVIHTWKEEFMLILLEYYALYKAANKKLSPPSKVHSLVRRYQLMSNPVQQFWNTATKPQDDFNHSLTGLFEHYKQWFAINFGRAKSSNLNANDFIKELERIAHIEKREQCGDTHSRQKCAINRNIVPLDEINDQSDDDLEDDE